MRNNREHGSAAEQKAAAYLEKKGFAILAQNYQTPYGETDIVALDGGYIVFIEVKSRFGDKYGYGREAVTGAKQQRYRNCAMYFLQRNHYDRPVRFDVVEVSGREMTIEHIANAF